MSKKELIKKLAEITGLNQKDAERVIEGLVQIAQEELIESGDCKIPSLGKFTVVDRKEHIGTNPITKENMMIPASKNVKFKPCKSLRQKLKD